MTIKEAKEKKCPINNNLCIANDCPKWEYTETRKIYKYRPDNSCKCGKQTSSYKLCWDCGDVATPEKAYVAYEDTDLGELTEDEKQGKCNL